MKVSPDVFLSQQLGIRYDGSGLHGSPKEIVNNLTLVVQAYDAGTYQTPEFVQGPVTGALFNSANVAKLNVLKDAYEDSLKSGDVRKVHKAVDALNNFRMRVGGQETIPYSDFEIVAHGQNDVGSTARWILGSYDGGIEAFIDDKGPQIRKYAGSK